MRSLRGFLFPPGLFRRLRRQSVLLVLVALVVLESAAYLGLQAVQSHQVTETLQQASDRIEQVAHDLPPAQVGLVDPLAPSDLFVAFVAADNSVVTAGTPVSTDDVPVVTQLLTAGELVPDRISDHTAPGGTDYSMTAVPVDLRITAPDTGDTTPITGVVVGYPLDQKQRAARSFLIAELVFAVTVLFGWFLLSRRFVRGGLQPLSVIAGTAEAIAAGRTRERLTPDPGDPELSRVSAALNDAFDARQHSEDRMREFVADASHELRTPLASVRGWADLYREGGIDDWDGVETAMGHIWQEAERMQVLVDEMLLLARLESAPGTVVLEPVPLTPFLPDTVSAIARLYPSQVFVAQPLANGLAVLAEPVSLRRAVSNLLVNAGRHTPAGTTVTVSASRLGHQVELRVEDDGPGMTEEERAAAFDRFWRGDRSRGRPGGTGLGLPICRSVFRGAGGDLLLQASPSGGLAAIATLPAP